jgi:non-specific protein-tyrosine kinase
VEGLQQLTKTLTEIVNSRPIAETATERLNSQDDPEDLLTKLRVQQIPETQIITVSYRDFNPEKAQAVANTIGEVVYERIAEVSPDANNVTVTMWESATLPASPASPNIVFNILAALMLSTGLALALVFLLENFDDKRNRRKLEEAKKPVGVTNGAVRRAKRLSAGG